MKLFALAFAFISSGVFAAELADLVGKDGYVGVGSRWQFKDCSVKTKCTECILVEDYETCIYNKVLARDEDPNRTVLEDLGPLLTKEQEEQLVIRVNSNLNLPFVDEEQEHLLLSSFVGPVNKYLAEALSHKIHPDYIEVMRVFLSLDKTTEEKRKQIQEIFSRSFSKLVSRILNERIDIPILNDEVEGKALTSIVDELIQMMVEKVVNDPVTFIDSNPDPPEPKEPTGGESGNPWNPEEPSNPWAKPEKESGSGTETGSGSESGSTRDKIKEKVKDTIADKFKNSFFG